MKFLSTIEKAKEWGISNRRVQILASTGRIEGAQKIGGVWLIPNNTKKPTNSFKDKTKYYATTSKNRRNLKNLLKESYLLFGDELTDEEFRVLVISTLNSNIIKELVGNDINDFQTYEMAEYVYRWMLRSEDKILSKNLFNTLFEYFKEYIHLLNGDILNIISWSYQYLNEILSDGDGSVSKTQFFTEQYMINFLLSDFSEKYREGYIFDPCCGGGNMLTAVLEKLVTSSGKERSLNTIENALQKIIGYDIDSKLACVSILNLRIKCIELLKKGDIKFSVSTWESLTPNIYYSEDYTVSGMLSDDIKVTHCISGVRKKVTEFFGVMDIVITNPPFATVKGMSPNLREFLKRNYPNANCDICISFIMRSNLFLNEQGQSLMVVQNSWMFLDSFQNFRKNFLNKNSIIQIMDLGSGAFLDLNGEKSNIALIIFKAKKNKNDIQYYSLKNKTLEEKMTGINNEHLDVHLLNPTDILSNENARFDVLNVGTIRSFYYSGNKISDFAVPMQGTSTGDNKKLVGYFWEHFGESEWKPVSKGGGYSRWQGLNKYVVKWGENGEYIKSQKGSALRNIKHFNSTDLVFSDTGTSGLNVRILLPSQIFIASGPGIRINYGDMYALLAVLNSRLASYYIRILSPKLTIAAGYIAKIPINKELIDSSYLSAQAKICISSKQLFLMNRPNNLEFSLECVDWVKKEIDTVITKVVSQEIKLELQKLDAEENINNYIFRQAEISTSDIKYISKEIGVTVQAYNSERLITVNELDKEWANATDASLMLSKNRVMKHMLGSDGIIEFLSHKFLISPSELVEYIEKNILNLHIVRKKYKDLIFHNYILFLMDFNVKSGVRNKKISVIEVINDLSYVFSIPIEEARKWVISEFYEIHSQIFYNKPFLSIDSDFKNIEEVILFE